MNPKILVALPGVAACVIVTLIYPFVLRYAIRHNIVDNPNARKLQRTPVPVFGGVAVFMGVLPAVVITGIFFNDFPTTTIIGKTNRDEIQNQMRLKFARKLQKRNVTEKSRTSYSQKWLSNVN